MKKFVSMFVILITIFFMSGCDKVDELDIDGLPGIELVGESEVEVLQYSEFVDPGAVILGDFDLDVVIESNVDTNTLGIYTITYTISYLEIEYVITRTIEVVEELSGENPGLAFIGDTTIQVEQYSTFIDPGVDIIGDFDLDIVIDSNVDTNTLGEYTITYTISYLEIEYTLTRTVEVVLATISSEYNISYNVSVVTDSVVSVTVTIEDVNATLANTYINIYNGETLVESVLLTTGINSINFGSLDGGTDYEITITGSYLATGTSISTFIKYSVDVTTLVTIEPLTVTLNSFNVEASSIELDITVVDNDGLFTSGRVTLYAAGDYYTYDVFVVGDTTVVIDYLDPETTYEVQIEYYYVPQGSSIAVEGTLPSFNITTPSIPVMNVSNYTIDITESAIDIVLTLNTIGFNDIGLFANIYQGDTYVDYYYIGTDSYFDFYELDSSTEYTIYLYADYTYGGVEYSDILIGTYTATTLDPIVYNPPVITNVVISRTPTSVTVDFDLTDEFNTMDSGYLRIFRGSYSFESVPLVEGHNSYTFDSNVNENTLHTIRIDADYKEYTVYETLYEEDVFTPPVITLNSFEQTEMFYENDYLIMHLELENDEEVAIDFVTINGERYSTYRFPSDIDSLYVDMGVESSAGNYVMTLENVGITINGEEYLVILSSSDDVPVYVVGTMVPSDATVTVIDMIPEAYSVNIDNDIPAATTGVNISIYLENKYNLLVSSITIGGVTYTGGDLTVVSPTELLVTALFSFDDANSNNNIYFSSILFERNGSFVSNTSSDPVNFYIYEIFNRDWDDTTAEVIHVSTPEELLAMHGDPAKPQIMYVLDNDIDMSGYNFIPIGTYEDPFTGGFDGNGYTISNITISGNYGTDNGTEYIGLFGYSKGVTFNLNLVNVTINVTTTHDNYFYIGALAGKHESDIYNVNIYNSSITINGIISGAVGGFVGQHHGDIIWSSADTDISIEQFTEGTTNSTLYVGGLVGNKAYEDVRSSYATGDITIVSPTLRSIFTGGLIGYIYNGGSSDPSYVINSYATGDVSVYTNYYGRTGGLIGDTYMYSDTTIIKNTYSSGDVTTQAGTSGGLIGDTYNLVISSFATGTLTKINGGMGRIFGSGNEYKLENIYAYDAQVILSGPNPINGNDYYYDKIGIATALEFNDANYYIDHLGWNSHFFDFSNLDVSNKDLPTLN